MASEFPPAGSFKILACALRSLVLWVLLLWCVVAGLRRHGHTQRQNSFVHGRTGVRRFTEHYLLSVGWRKGLRTSTFFLRVSVCVRVLSESFFVFDFGLRINDDDCVCDVVVYSCGRRGGRAGCPVDAVDVPVVVPVPARCCPGPPGNGAGESVSWGIERGVLAQAVGAAPTPTGTAVAPDPGRWTSGW